MLPFSLSLSVFFITYSALLPKLLETGDNKEMELENHSFEVMFLFDAMPFQYIEPLFILVHRKF
jgi:hypothetical protein